MTLKMQVIFQIQDGVPQLRGDQESRTGPHLTAGLDDLPQGASTWNGPRLKRSGPWVPGVA